MSTLHNISETTKTIAPEALASWLGIQSDAAKNIFHQRLAAWETDKKKLQARSAQFSKLQNYLKLKDHTSQLNTAFADLASIENDLARIVNTNSELEKESYSELIFTNQYLAPLNFLPFALTLFAFLRIWLLPLSSLLMPILILIGPYIVLHYVFNTPIPFEKYSQLMVYLILGQPLESFQTHQSSLGTLLESVKANPLQFAIKIGGFGFTFLQSVIQPYWNWKHLQTVNANILADIAYLKNLTNIYDKVSHILKLPKSTISPNATDRQLVAWARLYPLSIKQLIQNLACAECQFRLATNTQLSPVIWDTRKPVPRIYIEDCFDYNVPSNLVKKFTFDSESRHSLLTGPNRGGKSTVLRGIATSVILAHSYGCAIGSYAALTPFHRPHICLKPDDLPGVASRFEREVQFAVKTLQAPPSGQFSLVLIDELFHSTNPPDALSASEFYLQQLWKYDTAVSVISTHLFPIVERAPNHIQRICCPATYKSDDSVEFSYELQPGICTVSSVKELLRQNGLYENT